MTDNPDKEPAVAPSADPPAENRRKMTAGKGVLLLVIGIAALALVLYLLIGLRALSNA